MALANLGRNKSKTVLVLVSLALSVVLLNVLFTFTSGFDMEKYLENTSCADFVVSSTDYFRHSNNGTEFISKESIEEIKENTTQTTAGCGYMLNGTRPVCWIEEEVLKEQMTQYLPEKELEFALSTCLSTCNRRGELVEGDMLLEGFDEALFEKLEVVKGDIRPMFQKNGKNAIALVVDEDDYGNIMDLDYPPLGTEQTITYIDDDYDIDSRTGKKADENTPEEFMEYYVAKSHDVCYTICAYVKVPSSIGFRYYTWGNSFVLPADRLAEDSQQQINPLFFAFDTPGASAEQAAESYLAKRTKEDASGLMYESKALLREEFEGFRKMFLLLGGLLCGIIGLVGILNFLNAVMTSILSRKREFAVLKAVGMTDRQQKHMLIFEGLFYALGASFAALVFSMLINPLLGNLMEKMFWFFSAGFTILSVLLAIPVFALLGWLIPSIMYRQAARQSVVERLREIE